MKKPLAVAVRIFDGYAATMAEIRTSHYDGSRLEKIVWTNKEERNRFIYDGSTLYYDERNKKDFSEIR